MKLAKVWRETEAQLRRGGRNFPDVHPLLEEMAELGSQCLANGLKPPPLESKNIN